MTDSVEPASLQRGREGWLAAAATLFLAWTPLALLTFHLRFTLLDSNGGGFEYLAQATGVRGSSGLSVWWRLGLFREDLLVLGVLAPAVLLPLLRYLRPLARGTVTWAIAFPVLLILFVELKAFWEVGAFLPYSVLAAGGGDVNRRFVLEYARWSSLAKFLLLLALPLGLTAAGAAVGRRSALLRHSAARALGLLGLVLIVLTTVSWLARVPPNPYQKSALLDAIGSFTSLAGDPLPQPRPVPLQADSLLGEYRAISHAPVPNLRSGPYRGAARGYDVIFLILETAPALALDVARPDALPPTLRGLARESFLAPQHYTTYPYTVRAIFSIFSSWYPSDGYEDFIKSLDVEHPQLLAPGIVRSARDAGYRTAVFAPDPVENWEHDGVRYRTLGFDTAMTPPRTRPPAGQGLSGPDQRRAREFSDDRRALEMMKAQIRRTVADGRHFLFSFQPQYSHGPWPGVTAGSTRDQAARSGLQLFTVIDSWLGELTALLRELGTLDHTLIVVVGDHGVRTRTEHPFFVGGTLSSMSFNVPLMIYAPGVLRRPQVIPWVTSHIDIAPSIADLLGFDTERGLEQGSAIWDSALAGRTTFFFARNYLGADGFTDSRTAYMYKYAIRTVFSRPWNGTLQFEPRDIVPRDGPASRLTTDLVARMTSLQNTWARVMIPSVYRDVIRPTATGRN